MDPSVVRRIIKIAVAGIIAIIALAVFAFIQQNGKLTLELPDDARRIVITRQDNGEEIRSIEVNEGVNRYSTILASDRYEVFVSTENEDKATSYFVEVPSFLRTVTRIVELHNQSKREKIGIGSSYCPILSGTDLYSYSCAGTDNLSRVATLSVENNIDREVIGTPRLIAAQSYRDGILAIHTTEYLDADLVIPTLIFIRDGKIESRKELPDALSTRTDDTLDYFLRINEQESEKFIITFNENRAIVAFDNLEDRGTNLQIPDNHDQVNQLTDALRYSGNQVTYALGSSSLGHRDPMDEDAPQRAHLDDSIQVRQYAIDSNTAQLEQAVTFEDVRTDNAALCTPSHICLNERGAITVHSLEDPSTSLATIYGVTSSIVPLDATRFIYLKENRAFIMNTENTEARQVYFSDNFKVKSLTASSQGIILNASVADGGKYAYSFLIPPSLKPADTNTFIDDVLPYPQGAIDGAVLASDFYKDEVVVKVQLDSWTSPVRVSGGGASDYTYDENEFNEKRDRILQQLREDGITSDDYRIRIIP